MPGRYARCEKLLEQFVEGFSTLPPEHGVYRDDSYTVIYKAVVHIVICLRSVSCLNYKIVLTRSEAD